jgi:N-acetyltransferase B complex (NatB) non catalytic subunit
MTLQSKLDKKYSLRNFALGTIYLSTKCIPNLTFDGLRPLRIQCTRYFAHYRRKNACFGDIQTYVAALAKAEQATFLNDIALVSDDDDTPLQEIYKEINVLKFDYMLRPWSVDDPNDLTRCWRLYVKGTQYSEPDADNLPGDDALLLGCYTLVKAYNTTSTSISTLLTRTHKISATSVHCTRSRQREK